MNFNTLKMIGSGVNVLATLPFHLMSNPEKELTASAQSSAWQQERDDILERANWLCKKIVVTPEQLMDEAPSLIGREYQGEWAIYCCSMLTHALANIGVLYPEKKEKCPSLIAKMIDIVNTPVIREYDTIQWKEDAMATLDGSKSHMTYLSILAWMITNYKFAGGDNRYDALLHKLCATLVRRMHESRYDLNLLSFPRKPIWIPDMLVTLVALSNYSKLFNGTYSDTVRDWVHNARTKWIHRRTGLLAGMLPGESRYRRGITIRGSHSALIASYLTMVDEDFAREQYQCLCKVLRKEAVVMGHTICGVKEYLTKSPKLRIAPGDAGLIVQGISAGGTAFALGAATFFEDWEFRYQMLRTAEMAGGTVKEKRRRHYKIAKMFLVGEATALAMRTNVKR